MFFSALGRGRKKIDAGKKMIINVLHPEESRVAIIEDGMLSNLAVETTNVEKIKGNVYKGTVQRVEPSLHAAFVEYGGPKPGFLPLDEVRNTYYQDPGAKPGRGAKLPPGKILRKGQEVIVQISKEVKGTKGAALTTFISLPGRYLVLMPGYSRTGISRKIDNAEERQKLKDISRELVLPENIGVIVRTAGLSKTKKELQGDADYLVRLWKAIEERGKEVSSPALIYQESNMVIQSIRDYFTTDTSEVLIDNPEMFQRARDFFKQVIPKHYKVVRLYEDKMPIFLKYKIEEQIAPLLRRVVPLKSGGSISIDPTEALVAIDVNTGRFTRVKDPEESTLITNLEAADEIARQLRLRDLGGLIVIDFIDMKNQKNRLQVERQLRSAFKNDKANIEITRISQFGLLEMSRERLRTPLVDVNHASCPYCSGSGSLRSREAIALAALTAVFDKASSGNCAKIKVWVSEDAAAYLLNNKRSDLVSIEQLFSTSVDIFVEKLTPIDSYRMETVSRP